MTWIVIICVGVGSYVLRAGPLLVLERLSISDRVQRTLQNAGTAAITALIVVSAKHGATGHAAVPTAVTIAVATVLAARGASIFRLLIYGGGIYVALILLANVFVA